MACSRAARDGGEAEGVEELAVMHWGERWDEPSWAASALPGGPCKGSGLRVALSKAREYLLPVDPWTWLLP